MNDQDGTLDELASLAGEPLEELCRWQDLGLLPEGPDAPVADRLERIRLIRFAVGRGFSPERLAAIASAHGDMIGPFVESFGHQRGEPVAWSIEEVAAEEGIDVDTFGRLRTAAGLQDQRVAYREDVDAIRLMKTALDDGLPPEVLTQMLRVMADATNKIADSASRLFHLYIHEQMRASGSGGAELLQVTNAIS